MSPQNRFALCVASVLLFSTSAFSQQQPRPAPPPNRQNDPPVAAQAAASDPGLRTGPADAGHSPGPCPLVYGLAPAEVVSAWAL